MSSEPFEIPRIIHVIWIGPQVPVAVEELCSKLTDQNPDFEIRLWRDHDLCSLENQQWLDAEPTMSGKSDIARFEILRDHGGIYLDADFDAFHSLQRIIDLGQPTGLVVARELRTAFNGAFAACSPHHPFAEALVHGVGESMARHPHSSPVVKTGPAYFTRTLLDYLANGGQATELPQPWVYPYSHDRPDLAVSAVSSETLLRHEWATMGGKWGKNTRSAPNSRGAMVTERLQATRNAIRPANLKAQLSVRPEPHLLRDALHNVMSRVAGIGANTSVTPPERPWVGAQELSPSGTATLLPAAVRSALGREIHRHIRGSAVFMDIGLPDPHFWQLAARRVDRPGRALRLVHRPGGGDVQQSPPPMSSRGSLAKLYSEHADLSEISACHTQGSPLRPRVIDRSRSLDRWDLEAQRWTLDELVESCPHIELMMVWADADPKPVATVVTEMSRNARIGTLVVVLDPNSIHQRLSGYEDLFTQIESDGAQARCLGTISKQGINTWSLQLRVAQSIFAVAFNFTAS